MPKHGPLVMHTKVAGDVLCTDDYPTGLDKTPTFQCISDVALGTVGMVYPNHSKTDVTQRLLDHFTHFVLPCVVVGDFAKQLHLGKNQISCRGRLVQLKSSPPHHQWLNPAERYVFRVVNITTYIKLDSQLPDRFTIECAEHAALMLMVSPVLHQGVWTSGYKVYFKADFNYNMLKRIGSLVYVRLQKKQRVKFGVHGALGVLIGLGGFKFPDFTYKVWMPNNEILFVRDCLIAEDYRPFAVSRKAMSLDHGHWLSRGIGVMTRSLLRENDPDSEFCLDGWDDGSLAIAAANLANDPSTFL